MPKSKLNKLYLVQPSTLNKLREPGKRKPTLPKKVNHYDQLKKRQRFEKISKTKKIDPKTLLSLLLPLIGKNVETRGNEAQTAPEVQFKTELNEGENELNEEENEWEEVDEDNGLEENNIEDEKVFENLSVRQPRYMSTPYKPPLPMDVSKSATPARNKIIYFRQKKILQNKTPVVSEKKRRDVLTPLYKPVVKARKGEAGKLDNISFNKRRSFFKNLTKTPLPNRRAKEAAYGKLKMYKWKRI